MLAYVAPIKQHAYQCPPPKRELMKKEVEYLLENGLVKHRPSSGVLLSVDIQIRWFSSFLL